MVSTNSLVKNSTKQFTLDGNTIVASQASPPITSFYTGHENATKDYSGSFVLSNGTTIRRIDGNGEILWEIDNNGDTIDGLDSDSGAVVALSSGGSVRKYNINDGSVIWENTQASNGPNSEIETVGILPSGDIITSSGSNINRFSDTGDLLNENYVDTQNYFSEFYVGMDVYNNENSVLMCGAQDTGNAQFDSENAWVLKIDASDGGVNSISYGSMNANNVSDFRATVVENSNTQSDFIFSRMQGNGNTNYSLKTGNGGGYFGSVSGWGEAVSGVGSAFIYSSGSSTVLYDFSTDTEKTVGVGGSGYAFADGASQPKYIVNTEKGTRAYSTSTKYYKLGVSNESNISVNNKTVTTMKQLIVSGGAEISGNGVISLMRIK